MEENLIAQLSIAGVNVYNFILWSYQDMEKKLKHGKYKRDLFLWLQLLQMSYWVFTTCQCL